MISATNVNHLRRKICTVDRSRTEDDVDCGRLFFTMKSILARDALGWGWKARGTYIPTCIHTLIGSKSG